MNTAKDNSSLDLVDRLGSALAGTHGRAVTLESLRSLVQMEVAEWRSESQQPTTDETALPVKTQITG